jgi:hypothetical protein
LSVISAPSTTPASIHGRRGPQRLAVRSLSVPIGGSIAASQKRVTASRVPGAATPRLDFRTVGSDGYQVTVTPFVFR